MMHRTIALVLLLVLGSAHDLTGTLPPPQEAFDLDSFMGQWYEIAVVSTCPYYMQRKRANPVILSMQLQRSETNFTITTDTFKNGTCKRSSTDYMLTDTPGRFFHHVAKFGADVDTTVVESNYEEYALLFQLSVEKPSLITTIIDKLYSRTVSVRPEVIDKFKTLVKQHEMNASDIIMNQWKGDCFPLN
ncbi:protein AMBP-like [Cynoglossus semilaevis]|uniref:protein AMBP-like n=1 Tax=Cynoglossus semilaevis TaxID=244447 RepID=UPI0004961A5D|nr:protein AMBP-like [Cynoglossus semilaevis]